MFDFGADRAFLEYMNKQERLFKVRDVEEFDTDGEDATTVKKYKRRCLQWSCAKLDLDEW